MSPKPITPGPLEPSRSSVSSPSANLLAAAKEETSGSFESAVANALLVISTVPYVITMSLLLADLFKSRD